jgi:intracellular sulfur oxidation DsrE/DsrF family protein
MRGPISDRLNIDPIRTDTSGGSVVLSRPGGIGRGKARRDPATDGCVGEDRFSLLARQRAPLQDRCWGSIHPTPACAKPIDDRKPDLELDMIASRSRRALLICTAVVMAGCWAADARAQVETPPAKPAQARTKLKKPPAPMHKLTIQVSDNDKAAMNLALNNAENTLEYYKKKGETVAIEIVTYGPGLHMLRADTSPVKDRIAPMALDNPSLKFIACAVTQGKQSKAEGKPVPLIGEAKLMPSGVVRLIELQSQGYAYIRP